MSKLQIKSLSIEEVEDLFRSIGQREYRAKQLINWLYVKNVDTFNEMTNFSKELRKYLNEIYSISALFLETRMISKLDGAEKYLFRTSDNFFIESVLIKNEESVEGRLTLCVSSQVGCAMGCRFCQTAKMGFKRNLTVAEIIDQLCQTRRISGLINNNIVFMGMGEPLLNYDNVLKASDIMSYSYGVNISTRKITISTCGIKESVERYIKEKRPYNLALSLNDTLPEKRRINMPIEKKYPISEISSLFKINYPSSRNRLTVVYIMRKDNISPDDVKRLKKMFNFSRIRLNLIPLNSGDHNFELPLEEDIAKFLKELEITNAHVSIRKSFGRDIDGACGQLSGKYNKNR